MILNLGRNSSKFIEEGFIRIKATEENGNVKLFVDDSGSGIPPEKRDRLFAKFQESLDVLSQGTVSTCGSLHRVVVVLYDQSLMVLSLFICRELACIYARAWWT